MIDICKAQEPVEVTSRISDVTVFLNGAQVTREADITFGRKTSVYAFRELPLHLDEESIQTGGTGNFIILSIVHQVNYLASSRKTAQVKMLQDSVSYYEKELNHNNALQSVAKNEEDLLNANRNLGSSEKGVVVSELKAAADFFRLRLTEIKENQLELIQKESKLKSSLDRLKKQLSSMNAELNKPTSEILVTIAGNDNASGKLVVTYNVRSAGWKPVYDIRVDDINNPIIINQNAMVMQNTGEDWEKVNLRLSTADPRRRGEKPVLSPWYINFEQPVALYDNLKKAPKVVYAAPVVVEENMQMDMEAEPEAVSAFTYTQVSEKQTNIEYNIKIPYNIPSDNQQYTINIQESQLKADFEYYCVPKIDKEAFLIARLSDWEDLNLMPGDMNLFFEGTYVGKSYLNTGNTKDTLDLSLGRDKSIVVTRNIIKDFTEERTIGNSIRENQAWDITVRNNKKQAVELRIEDQLPISMNKDISVESVELSEGSVNENTGTVSWKLTLNPGVEKKLRIAFMIKYPKDKYVIID